MCKSSNACSQAVLMVEGLIGNGYRGIVLGFGGEGALHKGKTGFRGDRSGGDTPGSIPNPAVKPSSADGTALVTGWKSRSSPRKPVFFV